MTSNRLVHAVFCAWCMLGSSAFALESTPPYEHAAHCVAALTTKAAPLAARYKAGDTTVESELLTLTESGFALIGEVYKEGLRKAQADELLEAAKKKQSSWPTQELVKLQAQCQTEGAKVLSDANGLERFLITSAARRRLDKLSESGRRSREAQAEAHGEGHN